MDAFLLLSTAERRLACLQVEDLQGLQAASVEKDFWVCWTLRELSMLPDLGDRMTFKGGTSLSKAWNLIERFSEDIDLVVDKDALGFAGEAAPERGPSKKQRKLRVKALREACRIWVQEPLLGGLATRLGERLGPTGWSLQVDPDADDGQCLLFIYPGAFPSTEAGYVRPVVKIELGDRSDDWPSEECAIQPYLAKVLPALAAEGSFRMRTLAAERTFWEKAMLLHEETFRPTEKPLKMRLARHYYDLWCLITRGVADRAAADRLLFRRVAEHREFFFHLSWVDYTTLRPGLLRLVPGEGQRLDWRRDYEQMSQSMFYGPMPAFDEVLRVVADFEQRFNATAGQTSTS